MTRVCYDYNDRFIGPIPDKGCFEGDLKPLPPDTDPAGFLKNGELHGNGKFDMVLREKDPSQRLYHLEAPKNNQTASFYFLNALHRLEPNISRVLRTVGKEGMVRIIPVSEKSPPIEVTIRGKTYQVLTLDDASKRPESHPDPRR